MSGNVDRWAGGLLDECGGEVSGRLSVWAAGWRGGRRGGCVGWEAASEYNF